MYGIKEDKVYDIELAELVATDGGDARKIRLDITDVDTRDKTERLVTFTDDALRQLGDSQLILPHLAVRVFLFDLGDRTKEGSVIYTQNYRQLYALNVSASTRNLYIGKLIYSFFTRLPDEYLNEDSLWSSTLFTPVDIESSLEYFRRGYDLFEYEGLGSSSFTIKPGKLRDLEEFLSKQETRTSATGNRYFQIVPLGHDLDSHPFVFVIMPFKNEELDQRIWTDALKPALEQKYPNTSFVRSDDITEAGKIDNQIYTAIVKAQKIIAEVSVQNPNVYYELGVAHSLDKRIFMIAKRSVELAFDTQTVRAEFYENNEDLRRIIAEKFEL